MNTKSLDLRPADTRGATRIDWLHSRHSFSFGGYHDPSRVNHGPLRVLNDDHVAPAKGFGAHPHRNAEIVSYVLAGALEHRDSLGNGDVIRAGQFQYMSAGSGVTHSEFNPSPEEPVHFLQIWLLPSESNLEPAYARADIREIPTEHGLQLIASDERDAPIRWRAAADLYRGAIQTPDAIALPATRRKGYLHLTAGSLTVDGQVLTEGDAIAIEGSCDHSLTAHPSAEFLWFDLDD